jgi:hypothetical protein
MERSARNAATGHGHLLNGPAWLDHHVSSVLIESFAPATAWKKVFSDGVAQT